jgi:hypothetical protein
LISVCVRPFPGWLNSNTANMPTMMLLKFHSLARVCLSICSRKRTFARSCKLLCQLGIDHSFPRNAFERLSSLPKGNARIFIFAPFFGMHSFCDLAALLSPGFVSVVRGFLTHACP